MLKFRWNLTEKLSSRLHDTWVKKTAHYTSLVFAIMVSTMISYSGFAAIGHNIRLEQKAHEAALMKKAEDTRQTICLTNVVLHEAGGESPAVRKDLGNVILAIAGDPLSTKARNVCDLAKIPGFFSHIKVTDSIQPNKSGWRKVFAEMTDVYNGDRVLPSGWQCVRRFRVSDDKLETLSDKSLKQLGFTVKAKGLRYFAAKLVPVDTRGSITFYSDRGGCKNPTQTAAK